MKPPRVLLVDSDAETRTILRLALQHFGFAVREAETAEAALEAVGAERPDVVITELWVAGARGACVLAALLRREGGARRPRVVVLTTRSQPGDYDVACRAGADRVHTKPAELARLLDDVRALAREGPLPAAPPAALPWASFVVDASPRRAQLR